VLRLQPEAARDAARTARDHQVPSDAGLDVAPRAPATAAAKMTPDTRSCSRQTLALGSETMLPVSGRASRALAADEGAIGAWLGTRRPLGSGPILRSPRDGVRRAEGSAGRRRRTRPRPRRRLRRSSAADPRA